MTFCGKSRSERSTMDTHRSSLQGNDERFEMDINFLKEEEICLKEFLTLSARIC